MYILESQDGCRDIVSTDETVSGHHRDLLV